MSWIKCGGTREEERYRRVLITAPYYESNPGRRRGLKGAIYGGPKG
jgi:hypothetical protein